jgi:hypothetical protein
MKTTRTFLLATVVVGLLQGGCFAGADDLDEVDADGIGAVEGRTLALDDDPMGHTGTNGLITKYFGYSNLSGLNDSVLLGRRLRGRGRLRRPRRSRRPPDRPLRGPRLCRVELHPCGRGAALGQQHLTPQLVLALEEPDEKSQLVLTFVPTQKGRMSLPFGGPRETPPPE